MLDECFSGLLVSGKNEELIKKVVVITNHQQLFFVLLGLVTLMSQTVEAVEAILIIFNVMYRFPNIRFLGSA
jgi:hypothetical protein